MMKSILFVQNGDYAEAYRRFAQGGLETYRDQKSSVDFVARLAPASRVTTFAFGADSAMVELASGLWAMGGTYKHFRRKEISALLDETEATHLVLRTPHIGFLQAAKRRDISVLPSFADTFTRTGIRNRFRNWKLARALRDCQPPCISNHSLSASRSVVDVLGFPPKLVVPMDRDKLSVAGDAKSAVADPERPTAFFAGALTEDKGVGDCLRAVAALRARGITLAMSFAGPGEALPWQTLADQLGITDQISFPGMLPNAQIRAEMRQHDFVIVPSRHSYAEGLPNTLCEGLVSRSVVVASDHPAFSDRLVPNQDCLIFSAADPDSLASCLERATLQPSLYRTLSENAPNAHDRLYVGMEWTALVTAYLDDPSNRNGWVELNSLETIDGS